MDVVNVVVVMLINIRFFWGNSEHVCLVRIICPQIETTEATIYDSNTTARDF